MGEIDRLQVIVFGYRWGPSQGGVSVHPIDVVPREDREVQPTTGTGGSGFWAVAALVAVVALVMVLALVFADGGGRDGQPPPDSVPSEGPLEPAL
jgi:hypothetical protein